MGSKFDNNQHIITINYVSGRSKSYEDTSFITTDSPRVLDVKTDLGKNENAHNGYFVCDGPGDIKWEFSDDGTNYGDQHTVKDGDMIDLNGYDINKIRLTWVSNSAYRIMVV